jgi:hypothetical protein
MAFFVLKRTGGEHESLGRGDFSKDALYRVYDAIDSLFVDPDSTTGLHVHLADGVSKTLGPVPLAGINPSTSSCSASKMRVMVESFIFRFVFPIQIT